MYQHYFDNTSEALLITGKIPWLSCFAFSDDPRRKSGYHVHDNETELVYVKKGVARLIIDSSLYVVHADDIVVIERDGSRAMVSGVNGLATTCTCALYGFQFRGTEENQLLQPHSYPVITTGQRKEVIEILFSELSMILPQSKNSQTSLLWDTFTYTLAILYYENFKNIYHSEQGYIKEDVLVKDILFYLNNDYREKITLERLSRKFRASVSYTCHELTREYRIFPTNYVIQRRMTEVKWSLTDTELSQVEISWRMGYGSVDHFARLFLRHVGCLPNNYHRQFKNCFAKQEILSEFLQPVNLAG